MVSPLFKKLNLGNHATILLLNSPGTFDTSLAELDGVTVLREATPQMTISFGIAFAVTQAELDSLSSILVKATEGD
jgi:hypothetical protein